MGVLIAAIGLTCLNVFLEILGEARMRVVCPDNFPLVLSAAL